VVVIEYSLKEAMGDMQACIDLILNCPTAGGGFSFFAAVPEAGGFFVDAK